MRRLCSLRSSIKLVLIAFSINASAEPANVVTSFSTISEVGSPQIGSLSQNRRNGFQSQINFNSSRNDNGLKAYFGAINSKNDYSQYMLQDDLGNTRPLSDTFNKDENNLALGLDYSKNENSLYLEIGQSISETPFRSESVSVNYSRKINRDLTVLGFDYSNANATQPKSYYIEISNGRRLSLPEKIKTDIFGLNVEQIFTERIKAYAQIDFISQTARPDALLFTQRTALALNENSFLKYELNAGIENKNQIPQDGRGIFDLLYNEIAFNRYISYDYLVGFGYGLLVESETAVNGQVDQIASDIFQLQLAYQGKKLRIEINSQILLSNTNYNLQNYGGSLDWTF